MSEELQECPLITEYTQEKGINPELLEKLYALRSWEIDGSEEPSNPIPFKRPALLRTFIYDTAMKRDTETPLRIREYQKQQIHHLTRMSRFICGDGVGLGKTLSVVAAACWLKERNPDLKVVVITTKSTVYQWEDEFLRFSYMRPYIMKGNYRGKKNIEARYEQMRQFLEGKKKDVLIVKYDSLKGVRKLVKKLDKDGNEVDKRESVSQEIKTFTSILKEHRRNVVLVFDECHKFKGTQSSVRNLVFYLTHQGAGRVWGMTATAIKNGMDEFYAISTALGIAPFGYMMDFNEEFCNWREVYIGQGRYKKTLTGFKEVPRFKAGIRPFYLGRSQRQVKEPLPRLTTIYHPVDLDDHQKKLLFEQIPSGEFQLPPSIIKDAVTGRMYEKERDPDNMMTMLSVQQLVANHWGLIDRDNEKDFHTKTLSPKEEALLDMLDGDYNGEKVIVYTKYRSWIDRLEWLTSNGHFTKRKFLRITGAENEKKRHENKQLFQSETSGYDLIVINAAGMEGVNLQQAAHMILLDMPWSWGDLIQLVGRMVRMASPHSACTLHAIIAKGTIDEYTLDTLKGKKGVFEKILGESHSAGILDDGAFVNLDSGMEANASDEEFKSLLRAYSKSVSMTKFLTGEVMEQTKDEDYEMTFERKKGKKAKKKEVFEKSDKWNLDLV
jgi:SNF2 family DNA or RNA helicase